MRVKSLNLIDLSDIIKRVNASVISFAHNFDISSKTDLTNLFISRAILAMVDAFKSSDTCFTIFYLQESYKKEMISNTEIINYKKFFGIIQKKINFTLIISPLHILDYSDSIENSALYEEIINEYRSFSEILPKLIDIVRKFRYKRIDNEVIKETKNLVKLISTL